MKKTTEKIMTWWAKLGSLVVAFLELYGVYVVFFVIRSYLDIQEMRLEAASLGSYIPNLFSFGDFIFMLFGLGFSIVAGLYLYSPFLYYGWVKNPNHEGINMIAKTVSVIWSGVLIYGIFLLIRDGITNFTDISILLVMLAFAPPLYYFAWRK